jgi:hypothetical protein
LETLTKVVRVDEIVTGVVGRVDVDHFDLAEVGLLEELEHLQVVAFDDQVLGGVEVDALVAVREQGAEAGLLDGLKQSALPGQTMP